MIFKKPKADTSFSPPFLNEAERLNVCLFSGGRTSGFMLRRLLDTVPNYREKFTTIFCNTGKEREETLQFVRDVEEKWEVPVVWLEYDRVAARSLPADIFPTARRNANLRLAADKGENTHWFRRVDFRSAARNGEPFTKLIRWMTALPNVVSRACSMQLKIRTAMRYIFAQGVSEYNSVIGIRWDESQRAIQIRFNCDKYEHPQFPLIDWKVSEPDVLGFWAQNNFDLQLQSYEGNCDLCYLKAYWKRLRITREHPHLIKWWIEAEREKENNEGAGKIFRLGQPYQKLLEDAAKEEEVEEKRNTQLMLGIPSESDEDIPCSCAEKGFGLGESEI